VITWPCQDLRDARLALERAQHARLAQHVVCAGRQRAARRSADDDLRAVVARDRVGDVRMPVADRLDRQLTCPELVLVEERLQRLEHQQRLALVGRALLGGADDVVGGNLNRH
jgi:hypothetical protein